MQNAMPTREEREEMRQLDAKLDAFAAMLKRWSTHGAGGWVSALDLEGRTIWIVDAHGYGKCFIVRADEMLTAFVELERAIHEFAVSLIS